MKRTGRTSVLAAVCALLICLGGCGFLRPASYVSVSPHREDAQQAVEGQAVTVNSYFGLKNAVLSLVQDGEEDGVIRAESYSGNLAVDLSRAVYEVSQNTPLGAYAVTAMTYDYSRIVSYYEIHVSTTFRRTPEELQSIGYAEDQKELLTALTEAMERYDPRLVLWIGDYSAFDPAREVEAICLAHPEFALERPETSMELYPDSGPQRIMELKFTYSHSARELEDYRQALEAQVAKLAELYGNAGDDMTRARRLYERLGRDAVMVSGEDSRSVASSAAGALLEGSATSRGFAQAYRLLLEASGIPCELISGQRSGAAHDWCRLKLDGAWYYADPSQAAGGSRYPGFLMGDLELEMGGYTFQEENRPESVLPYYLRTMQPGS